MTHSLHSLGTAGERHGRTTLPHVQQRQQQKRDQLTSHNTTPDGGLFKTFAPSVHGNHEEADGHCEDGGGGSEQEEASHPRMVGERKGADLLLVRQSFTPDKQP